MERATVIFFLASFGMALVVIGANIWDSQQPNMEDDRILDVCLQDHTNDITHYHAALIIEIRGEQQTIPAETGVSPGCMRGIHTHDETGKLHIETPEPMDARLEHFFEIWGESFTDSSLLGATVEAGESITLTVDGEVVDDPANHLLADGQELVLKLE